MQLQGILLAALLLCLPNFIDAQTLDSSPSDDDTSIEAPLPSSSIKDDKVFDEDCQTIQGKEDLQWYIGHMRDVIYPYIKKGLIKNDDPILIPLYFNAYRNDDGTAWIYNNSGTGVIQKEPITTELIDNKIVQLNERADGSNIVFYRLGDVNFIDMSSIYNPDFSCVDDMGEPIECPNKGGSSFLSYVSYAINIDVGLGASQTFSPKNIEIDNYNYCTHSHRNKVYVRYGDQLRSISATLEHELGHRFGLRHVFSNLYGTDLQQCIYESSSPECAPATCVSAAEDNSPYSVNPDQRMELVIRDDDPTKAYPCKNWDIAGDLLEDTPAIPRSGWESFWLDVADPNCDLTTGQGCSTCLDVDHIDGQNYYNGTCIDYNGDPFSDGDADTGVRNIMNYGSRRTEFTNDQKGVMSYWSIIHEQNLKRYHQGSDISGAVFFQNSPSIMPRVSLFFDGPETENFCRSFSDRDGKYQATSPGYENVYMTNAQVQTLGSGEVTTNTISAKCEPIIIYEYTDEDWLAGVTIEDIQLIQEHVDASKPVLKGFDALAADVNMDGSITQADVAILTEAFVNGDLTNLRNTEKPWYFVPGRYVSPFCWQDFYNDPFSVGESCLWPPEDAAPLNTYATYAHAIHWKGPWFSFHGYKLGDVNGSAISEIPNSFDATDPGSNEVSKRAQIKPTAVTATNIYPNPSTGIFNLNLKAGHTFTMLSIYDNTGRNIMQKALNENSDTTQKILSINISKEKPGIYLVKLVSDQETQVVKILKL